MRARHRDVVPHRALREAILVNSFDAVEPEAVEALRHPTEPGWPPMYHVGPLILQSESNCDTNVDVNFFQREEAEHRQRGDSDGEAWWEKKKWGGDDLPAGQLDGCLVT